MLHLLKYSFLSKIRNFNDNYSLAAGLSACAWNFFYFVGNINEADFQTVPVAVVKEASAKVRFS